MAGLYDERIDRFVWPDTDEWLSGRKSGGSVLNRVGNP